MNICYKKSLKEKFDEFLNELFDEICKEDQPEKTPSELNKLIGKKLNKYCRFIKSQKQG